MPIFAVPRDPHFPPPELSEPDGLLAVGGDLQPARLLLAYESGIFPWFSEGEPILWWSPNPRFVLYPQNLKVSKSMKQVFRKKQFQITYDQKFSEVIQNCQQAPRPGQSGTWITPEMIEAYERLHYMGFAHSVEVWENNKLVGGLYGVSLGKAFFGESMFARVSNASKAGFITLVQDLTQRDFEFIDCQVYTNHLASLGAELIERKQFLKELGETISKSGFRGNWGDIFEKKSSKP